MGISIYGVMIRVAALFNYKVALGMKGRENWFLKLQGALEIRKPRQSTFWFHCASLGEFELALPVIQEIKKRSDVDGFIVVSFFSPSGYEARKDHPDLDVCTYLPIDTPSNAVQIFDLIRPQWVMLVKYEFWYYMLREAHRRSVSVYVIGARFRRQMIYFTYLKGFYMSLFKWIEGWFVQDHESLVLLSEYGISNVRFYGDTRVDRTKSIAEGVYTFEAVKHWKDKQPVLVLGSVWPKDLEVLTPILPKVLKTHKLMIAPHEMDEAFLSHIESIFPGETLRYSHYSNVAHPEKNKVLIIDHVGDLAKLYRYGEIAYIGGAFGSGLHNIYEPLAHKLPVIFGPKVYQFPEAGEVVASDIGRSIKSSEEFLSAWQFFMTTEPDFLKDRIDTFLSPSIGAAYKIICDICAPAKSTSAKVD